MPPITPPVAGSTHHLVLKYGPPSSPSYQGLMLPDGDLRKYIVQPYTPFAPQSRQGNATIQDFSVATVWELNADFAGGTGHTRERKVESGLYAYAQGNNVSGGLGTTLFTAQKGKLLPAPAHVAVSGISAGNVKQFIEHDKNLYALTDESPGKIYKTSGSALFIPANGEYLSRVDEPTISTGDIDFAWAGWVCFDSLPTTEVVLVAKENEYRIGKNTSQQLYFKAGTTDTATDTATVLKTKQWYFVACWHDSVGNTVKIQVNNGTIYSTAETVVPTDTANPLTLGVALLTTLHLNGRMGSWGFYKGIPSAAVLTTLYNAGAGLRYADLTATEKTNLTEWWDLSETSGTRAGSVASQTLTDTNTVTFADAIGKYAGLTFTLVETLSGGNNTTGLQLKSDGNKLYCTRGSTQPVRSSANGCDWANDTFTCDYMAIRDNGAIAYVLAATLTWGGTEGYAAQTVGWSGTNVTMMEFLRGALVIGKPEGLWTGIQGRLEEKFPCHQAVDNVNFSKMTIHNNLLWFNFKNRLYFTDLQTITEVYPEDRGGFTAINCLTGTGGPLLIGAKWQAVDASETFSGPRSVTTPASDLTDDAGAFTVPWTNPQNAGVSDDVYATAITTNFQITHRLKALNFGFSIPATATITGVKIEIEGKVSAAGFHTIEFAIYKNGAVYTTSELFGDPLGTSDAYVSRGGPGNAFSNVVLTPADVNASNFGAGISIESGGGTGTRTFSIDHIRMTIYYTLAGSVQNALFMLESVQDAGLNPLWTDVDGSNPMFAAYATSAPDANASRVYTCSNHANWKVRYIDLDTRFLPKAYDTNTSNLSYIDLTEFSAGFASVKKWWYECVLNAVNPLQTTFVKAFYSIDGANFTQTLDQMGAVVEHTVNTRSMGSYFPLDTVGTYNQIRLYLRTTATTGAAAITTVTLRGDVMVKPRYQFQFPVDCSETVQPLQGVAENGNAIWQNLRVASQQGYPCKFQDPEGNWHLVLFQTSPYFSAVDYRVPSGGRRLVPYGAVTVVLEEIDALASDGSFNAWGAG